MSENGYFILNNEAQLPKVGLGTWKSKASDVIASVKCAISEGYRHIDCAYVYNNEEDVGKGISAKITDGTVNRQDLFVTSKGIVGHLDDPHVHRESVYHCVNGIVGLAPYCNQPDKVEPCCKESLKKLGLDYVDLYLIHWPVATNKDDDKPLEDFGVDVCYTDTWKAMEELVKKGYCKSIGVSNFNKAQLEEICSMCTIKPVVNQIEVHPYLTSTKIVDYCKSKDIIVTAYSPFASPDKGRDTWNRDDPKPMEDPFIKEIASKHNVLPAQVILKWLVQRGMAPIPKSVTPERIKANIQLKHFNLTDEDIERINNLNIPFRCCCSDLTPMSKYYPFNDEY